MARQVGNDVDWSRFLNDVREELAGEEFLIKDDLLAFDTQEPTPSSESARPLTFVRNVEAAEKTSKNWTPALAMKWAHNARPHVRKAISVLAASKVPMSTLELNEVSGGRNSGGAITGGLNAWATRNALPMPLAKQGQNGKVGYLFMSDAMRDMFTDALA